MAVIARVKATGQRAVLIGTGFGAYRSARPSFFFGELAPKEKSGELPVVALCNEDGDVMWVHSKEIEIESVDGVPPADILASH